MIDISPSLSRYLSVERTATIYQVAHRRRQLLGEARAAVTNEHLTAWRSEARALVEHLEAAHESDTRRIAAFENAAVAAEAAVLAEAVAVDNLYRCRQVYAAGALERETQLRHRDDVEAAVGVLAVRQSEREAAVHACLHGLPPAAPVDECTDARAVAESFGQFAINRKFYADQRKTAPDRETLQRWFELREEEMRWIGLYAARVIADAEKKRSGLSGPEVEYVRGGVREQVILPISEYAHDLESFKNSRRAHIQRKVTAARTALENAAAAAASLEGAAQ